MAQTLLSAAPRLVSALERRPTHADEGARKGVIFTAAVEERQAKPLVWLKRMNNLKRKRLESAGWAVGDTTQFLHLSEQESRFLDLKLVLASAVRELRERKGLTQAALASTLRSSQSRVAKMEAGDPSVSLDLLMRSLLAIGASTTEIAKWIKRSETKRAA